MALRRGYSYPLQIESGGLKLSEDFDLIREAIEQVLVTIPTERIMQPNYGTPDYVFTATPLPVVIERIRTSLEAQIREVTDFEITGKISENGAIELTIGWYVDGVPQPPILYRLSVDPVLDATTSV
jgi:hypothetical protein